MEFVSLGFAASVFGAGLLSFFSPCILPLLPVYVGYLSADSQAVDTALYKKLLKTLAFVAGLSVTFFLLGFGAGALGEAINNSYFFIACGLVVFVFGLFRSGLVDIPLLNREKRLDAPASGGKGAWGAFLLGLVFSFGWTPCVGPVLGSVLGLSAQQGGALAGGGLLLIYSLGLGIPFLVITIGSNLLLGKVKKLHKYLPKIKLAGGILIAVMGLYMVFSQVYTLEAKAALPSAAPVQAVEDSGENFTLQDRNGNAVSLSDYRGKPVYIKFWASWCPMCLAGLEDFSAVAQEYNEAGGVRVLSVVMPGLHGEMDEEGFNDWADGQRLDFPILFDKTGEVNEQFRVKAYPTSVFLDKNGEVKENKTGDIPRAELESKLESLMDS